MVMVRQWLQKSILVCGLLFAAAPSGVMAVGEVGQSRAAWSPRATEEPGTREARSQVETGRSIADPEAYLTYVKSLGNYQDARDYGDKV
jgi:hypothetical protein